MNKLITIAQLSFQNALFIQKELRLENVPAFFDFSETKNQISNSEEVKLQIEEPYIQKAISLLISITNKTGHNPLSSNSLSVMGKSIVILVPVDLKGHSFSLGKSAISLARKIEAEIKFLHVYYEPDRISNSVAFERFLHTVHAQEEQKAKEKMLKFSELISEYAELVNFPSSSIHFGLTAGRVSEQIVAIADKCKSTLILMGPRIKKEDDDESDVLRNTVRNSNVSVFVLPKLFEEPNYNTDKAVYFVNDINKMQTYQKRIESIFTNSASPTLLYAENINKEEIIELGIASKLTLIDSKSINTNIMDYLKETGTTLLIFDNPKSAPFARFFGNDLSYDLIKQEEFPVLFLE